MRYICRDLSLHWEIVYRKFWRQIAEQLYCDRFRGILRAQSSQFNVFAAIYTKFRILIGPELLINFRNTVTE